MTNSTNQSPGITTWIIHVEFIAVLVTLIGGLYLLDGKIETLNQSQCSRTDKLYEMFIDLLKEKK